jgi:hypothetical protein
MKILLVENRPTAGFFSNLNVLLKALMVLYQSNIYEYYVVWKNPSYGDPDENLFEKYFYKQSDLPDASFKLIHAIQLAQPHIHIDHSFFINELLHKLKFFDSKPYREAFDESVLKESLELGVHVRYNHQHHYEVPTLGTFIENIERIQKEKKTEKCPFFVATDHKAVLSAFSAHFNDSGYVCNENVYRPEFFNGNHDHIDWGIDIERDKLAKWAIQEAISLSCCKEVLYAGSNVVEFSAAINPGRYYHLLGTKALSAWDGGFGNVKKLNRQKKRII